MDEDDNSPNERAPLLSRPAPSPAEESRQDQGHYEHFFGRARQLCIVLSIGCLILLQASNISLLTTTQSDIAADLDAFAEASWFTSSYLIAMSSVTPLGGRLTRIFSANAYITASSAVVVSGTLITAFAPSLPVFLLGRTVTGVGGAGCINVAIILVLELVSEKRRGLFLGLLNTVFTVGVSFGAVVAGALAPRLGWRAVFWLQAPIAFAAGVGVYLAVPKACAVQSGSTENGSPKEVRLIDQLARIDYFGMLTLVPSLVLFLFGFSSSRILLTPIGISIGIFALFVLIEAQYAKEPVVPVHVLKSRAMLLTCLATLGLMMARWTVLFYNPVYALAVRAWSPASAGLILLPTTGGFAIGGLLVGWIHIRRAGSFYLPSVAVLVLFSASLFALAHLSTPETSAVLYMIVTFANGFVTGACLNYTLVHLLHLIPKESHVIVTPLVAMFRGFAGSFGSAIGGGVFSRALKSSLEKGFQDRGLTGKEELVRKLLGSPALVAQLSGEDRMVARDGYITALKALFLAGTALALFTTIIQAGTGWRGAEEGDMAGVGISEEDE